MLEAYYNVRVLDGLASHEKRRVVPGYLLQICQGEAIFLVVRQPESLFDLEAAFSVIFPRPNEKK